MFSLTVQSKAVLPEKNFRQPKSANTDIYITLESNKKPRGVKN
jgi:hypothetical protein